MKQAKSSPPLRLPFALVETGTRGLRIVALNATAKSFGLSCGQRLADARAQVPDLLSELHESEHDMASLLGLCRWMERYSPWVSPDMPDGILLDVTGIPHLFGGEASMLNDMRERLAHYGFTTSIAISKTIGAAWALARYSQTLSSQPPSNSSFRRPGYAEAKLQLRQGEKPESPPSSSQPDPGLRRDDELEGLPIEALRINGEATRTLRRLGLKTIGSLLNIPRSSLARRFRGECIHENVLTRLDEALGVRDEPLNPLNPPSSFMAHRALMEPLISTQGLESLLTSLVTLLTRDLEMQNQGALRLILKLFRTDGSRISIPAGLTSPSHDPAHIFRLLKPRLETIDAGFGIDAMTLEARETAIATSQQYGFMEDTSLTDFDRLNDRVMNRHEAEIASLISVESHIPERAEKKSPAQQRRQSDKPSKSRPLLIFENAEATSVIASVPDGPPMRFTWRKVTRRVLKSQGPERIAPEWWQLSEGERPRDYYVIEDELGRRYWLYREGLYGEPGEAQPKWFVHGLSA
jgi:protein ImuB